MAGEHRIDDRMTVQTEGEKDTDTDAGGELDEHGGTAQAALSESSAVKKCRLVVVIGSLWVSFLSSSLSRVC